MKINKSQLKHFGYVSCVLGGIACVSALLIAVSYMITQPIIDEYNDNLITETLVRFYPDATFSSYNEIDDSDYSYLNGYYEAYDSYDNLLGYIFSTSGANGYGSIDMLVSLDAPNFAITQIYLTTNGQSYATTLQNNYVDPFNNGEIGINDVNMGATYGATLIRDMAVQAQDYITAKLTTSLTDFYPDAASFSTMTSISDENYEYLLGYYEAYDDSGEILGYIFSTSATNDYGTISMLVSLDAPDFEASYIILTLIEHYYGDIVQSEYVDKFNNGEITLDEVDVGATTSASLVREMARQAEQYVANVLAAALDVFYEDATFSSFISVENENYEYILGYYEAYDSYDNLLGYIFSTSSTNSYGSINMLVSLDAPDFEASYILLTLIEHTYGDLVQSDYVDDFNNGNKTLDDVDMGATTSASVVREMALQAEDYVSEVIIAPLYTIYADASFNTYKRIENDSYEYLLGYYEAYNSDDNLLGYIFSTSSTNSYGSINMLVSLDAPDFEASYILLTLIEHTYGDLVQSDYVDDFNNGNKTLDDVDMGATTSASVVREMALQAEDYVSEVIIAPLYSLYANATFSTFTRINDPDYSYLVGYYEAFDGDNNQLGYVFSCVSIAERYGAINLLVALDAPSYEASQIVLTLIEHTYGELVQTDYVDEFNDGNITLDDVNMGATSSATYVKDMVRQAELYASTYLS